MNDDTAPEWYTEGLAPWHLSQPGNTLIPEDFTEPDRVDLVQRVCGLMESGVEWTPIMLDQMIATVRAERGRVNVEPTRRDSKDPRRPCVVYYLRFGDRVKIGTTANLRHRLAVIPHDEVLATEPGSYDVEAERHAFFAPLRVKGEWFRYESPLTDYIGAMQG